LLQDFYSAVSNFLIGGAEWEKLVCAGQPVSWAGISSLCAHVWVIDFAAHLCGVIKQVTGVPAVKFDANGVQEADLSLLLDKLDDIRTAMCHVPPVVVKTVQNHLEWEWCRIEKGNEARTKKAKPGTQKGRRRRGKTPRKPSPLTEKQTEAMQLVGEHKGNYTAAGKAAGKSRQAIQKLYQKATKKLGKKSVELWKTQRLPTDRRGQVNVEDPNAEDMNASDY
jgi:hypothetical protein